MLFLNFNFQYYTYKTTFLSNYFSARTAPVESTTDMISPITGEKIPANKVQEHMRIGE
jgi:hypothetical protein